MGTVGVLAEAHLGHILEDLPAAFRDLQSSGAYVDTRILQDMLRRLGLAPLP
jgi:predicted nucleic acid-binding protein